MFADWSEFFEVLFTGPVWPPSVLICLLLAYSVLILLGYFELDLGLSDFTGEDVGSDWGDSGASLGALTTRWLNLDSIPIFIWFGTFGFCWWVLSLGLWIQIDQARYEPTLVSSLILAGRNLVIAILITKVVTYPLKRFFERGSAYRPEHLVGNTCEIETTEATEEFGRARYRTDGAPLLLNVRTRGESLKKGDTAQIIDFDPQSKIYFVQSVEAQQ